MGEICADGAFCRILYSGANVRSASAAVVRGMGRVPAADSEASRRSRLVLAGGED